MRFLALDSLILFLIISQGLKGDVVTSCNTVMINCGKRHIVITKINISSTFASYILEQCNRRYKCHLENLRNECINLQFWCGKITSILEMKMASGVKLASTQSLLSLMSEDYSAGMFMEAQNINCHLNPENTGVLMSMKMRINEFSVNSTEFCLQVSNSIKPPFCSGSRRIYAAYGPFNSTNGWKFNMTLANVNRTGIVRFWIDIDVSPNDVADLFHVECNSLQVKTGKKKIAPNLKTENGHQRIIFLSAIGSLLGVLVFTVISTVVCAIKRPCKRQIPVEPIYSDIDLSKLKPQGRRPLPSIHETVNNVVPDISSQIQHIDRLIHESKLKAISQEFLPNDDENVAGGNFQVGATVKNKMADLNEVSDDMVVLDNEVYGSEMSVNSCSETQAHSSEMAVKLDEKQNDPMQPSGSQMSESSSIRQMGGPDFSMDDLEFDSETRNRVAEVTLAQNTMRSSNPHMPFFCVQTQYSVYIASGHEVANVNKQDCEAISDNNI